MVIGIGCFIVSTFYWYSDFEGYTTRNIIIGGVSGILMMQSSVFMLISMTTGMLGPTNAVI